MPIALPEQKAPPQARLDGGGGPATHTNGGPEAQKEDPCEAHKTDSVRATSVTIDAVATSPRTVMSGRPSVSAANDEQFEQDHDCHRRKRTASVRSQSASPVRGRSWIPGAVGGGVAAGEGFKRTLPRSLSASPQPRGGKLRDGERSSTVRTDVTWNPDRSDTRKFNSFGRTSSLVGRETSATANLEFHTFFKYAEAVSVCIHIKIHRRAYIPINIII